MPHVNEHSELVELVRRIFEREPAADDELVHRYSDGIFQIIYQVVHNHSVAEDLRQDTLIKSLEKIRQGDVRDPARLSGFVRGIARFMALEYVRKMRSRIKVEDAGAVESVTDPAPDPYEQLLEKENAEVVRKLIDEMKVERDRDVLFRLYALEQDKDTICAALQISREQFSRIIFRANQRYKELREKLAVKT